MTLITDEELIAEIQTLADKLGHRPSITEMNENGEFCGATYTKRFGTWNNAIEIAGFERVPPGGNKPGEYRTCEECGNRFYVQKSRLERESSVRYCSMDCYNENRSGEQNPMYGQTHTEEAREKMKGTYGFPEGNGNPNYDDWDESVGEKARKFFEMYEDGSTDTAIAEELDISVSTVYSWRKKRGLESNYKSRLGGLDRKRRVLKENVDECQRCGYGEEPSILEVHHKDRDQSNNDWDNLELICPNCHEKHHFKTETGRYQNGAE